MGGYCDHSEEACECGMKIIASLRAELAEASRLHETEKRYLESVIADLTARLVVAESDATRARAARLLATGRADQSLARLAAVGRVECDPDCMHCAAWRCHGTGKEKAR